MPDTQASLPQQLLLGLQMLFVAFGALVLVPLLTGLNPNVALFTAGLGTLLFHFITGRQVPIFLASSFAFIAPIIYGVQTWGIPATMGGLMFAGLVYVLLSALVAARGVEIVHRLFPPVVVGPVIMLIGLNLAPVAVNMAAGKAGDGSAQLLPQLPSIAVATIALAVTAWCAIRATGFARLLSILLGIASGYIAALIFIGIDFSAVKAAPWFAVPEFVTPTFQWEAILFMLPVAIAPALEHIGDMLAIGGVTKKDFTHKPGLHRTLLGDGVATAAASALGGPPNTTYSEVTGAVMLTRVFNPAIMLWAAVFAIVLSFCGKLGAVLGSIPVPVMGGVLILLFGTIAAVGASTLAKQFQHGVSARDLTITSIVLVSGIGGMALQLGEFTLKGIGLAAVIAVILNLVLPKDKTPIIEE